MLFKGVWNNVVPLSIVWLISIGQCTKCENDTLLTTPEHGAARRLQFFFGMFTSTGAPPFIPTTSAPGGGGGVTAASGGNSLADVVTQLTFDEMYEIMLTGTGTNPTSGETGWNGVNMVYIMQYFSKPDPWLKTIWGQMITGIGALLTVVYIVVLLYAVYTVGYRRANARRVPMHEEIPKKSNASNDPKRQSVSNIPKGQNVSKSRSVLKGQSAPKGQSVPKRHSISHSISNGQRGPEAQNDPGDTSISFGPKGHKVRITEVAPVPPDYMGNTWGGKELPPPQFENIEMQSSRTTTAYPPSPVQDNVPDPLMYQYQPIDRSRNATPSEIIIRARDYDYDVYG